jgi:ABC-2 type transport system permease protein
MKRSAFNGLLFRLKLLKINAVNTWQIETAYFGDAWGNVLSTVAYTITYLVFISVIYANVTTLAGYTRDEMLFLALIGQLSFYSLYAWSLNNVQDMVADVNDGSFDLMLIKPLPALFYTTFRNITLLSILRDGIPALAFLVLAIHWANIMVTPIDLLLGTITFAAGQIAINGFIFLLAMPVFWFGQASDMLGLAYPFMDVQLPYEGVGRRLRLGLTLLIPALVPASLTASVILHKSNPWWGMGLAAMAAVLLLAAKQWAWKRALLSYTSASS